MVLKVTLRGVTVLWLLFSVSLSVCLSVCLSVFEVKTR